MRWPPGRGGHGHGGKDGESVTGPEGQEGAPLRCWSPSATANSQLIDVVAPVESAKPDPGGPAHIGADDE